MKLRTVVLAALATTLLLAPSAQAENDYGRPGWYLGVGFGAGNDFLDSAFEDATGGLIDISTSWSANVRGGYRVWSWMSIEAMYEGVYDIGISETITGSDLAKYTNHTLLVGPKFFIPIKRFQPNLSLAVGAQQQTLKEFIGTPGLDDVSRWDFAFRAGFGLDFYLTENWVINGDIALTVRVKDYGDIGSAVTDNVALTYGGGVQYRF